MTEKKELRLNEIFDKGFQNLYLLSQSKELIRIIKLVIDFPSFSVLPQIEFVHEFGDSINFGIEGRPFHISPQ